MIEGLYIKCPRSLAYFCKVRYYKIVLYSYFFLKLEHFVLGVLKYLNLMICYCMSNKSSPNLYSNLLYKMGQDFLDRQYIGRESAAGRWSLNQAPTNQDSL